MRTVRLRPEPLKPATEPSRRLQLQPTTRPSHMYPPERWPHLLLIEGSLDRRSVLHLLGKPTVSGASQMLLLHGGSNAYRSGLLVLQHVSEALDVGGKRRRK